jgi:hypothetical protein
MAGFVLLIISTVANQFFPTVARNTASLLTVLAFIITSVLRTARWA